MNCHCNKPSFMITDLSNYDKIYKCDECVCDFRKVISIGQQRTTAPTAPTSSCTELYHFKKRTPNETIKTNILLFEANPLLSKFQEIEFQLQSQGIPIFNHKKETMIEFIQRIKKLFHITNTNNK